MTGQRELVSSVRCVRLGNRSSVWLGVTLLSRADCWVVWLSTFGDDVQVLSAWDSQPLAFAAAERCASAATDGHDRLLAEIECLKRTVGRPVPQLTAMETISLRNAMAGVPA